MSPEIQYNIPEIPLLLTTISFLYLTNVADVTLAFLINAGLLGPLAIGIIYGSEVSNILPAFLQESFILLGYVGLLLLVFEAGLDTNIRLLYKNIYLSAIVAVTGIALPIGLSILLLALGYRYDPLQAFGAGAALSSTSLGTTLSLLRAEFKITRTGIVLMSAALIDDIVGLVLAAIIPQLSPKNSDTQTSVKWSSIVRPIGVSIAFGLGTPVLARGMNFSVTRTPAKLQNMLYNAFIQLFLITSILCGYIAGAKYAGTSELWGAYLAGATLSYAFPERDERGSHDSPQQADNHPKFSTPSSAFAYHIRPILERFLSPVFFASIGLSLPIRTLFLVGGSRRVIWRGIIYSILMVIAKALTGVWLLVWPSDDNGRGWFGRRRKVAPVEKLPENKQLTEEHPLGDDLPVSERSEVGTSIKMDMSMDAYPSMSGMFLGFAMVARGEIALIVAQLARPLLDSDDSLAGEPFAVVIWAILVTTVFGALAVGTLLGRRDKRK